MPTSIRGALLKIRQLERCKSVLSPTSNPAIFDSFRESFDLDLTVFAASAHEGSRLMPEDVREIELDARRCFEMDHDEPVWNAEVHTALLKKVFRRPNHVEQPQLVDFTLWYADPACSLQTQADHSSNYSTTAPIIRQYLPAAAPDRRIDLCIYNNPSIEPCYAKKIDALRQNFPETSINHTSYTALRGHPTTVSLETKRSGNDFDGAVLQTAVWQAGHWKMLRSFLQKTIRDRAAETTSGSTQGVFVESEDSEQYVETSLRKLGALHGIYSQGHEWYYVATSPEIVDPQGKPSLRTVGDRPQCGLLMRS